MNGIHVSFQSGLHSMLWTSRYVCAAVSLTLYLWEWYHYLDYGERNYRLLTEIKEMMKGRAEGTIGSSIQPSGPTDELIMKGTPQTRVSVLHIMSYTLYVASLL